MICTRMGANQRRTQGKALMSKYSVPLAFWLCLLLSSCASLQRATPRSPTASWGLWQPPSDTWAQTPRSTYTPYATSTPYPTHTPQPFGEPDNASGAGAALPPGSRTTPTPSSLGAVGDSLTGLGLGVLTLTQIERASLIADDGTYLGRISNNAFDSDSLANEYGRFGNPYSSVSIFNEYGRYGSQYSAQSPFNEYASDPPAVVKDGKVLGYLTANEFHAHAINVYVVVAYIRSP